MGVQARLGNPEVMAMDARMSSEMSHSQLGASLLCPETDSLWTGVGWTPNHRNAEKWRGVGNLSLWVSKLVLVFPTLIQASKCVSVVQLRPTLWDSMGCSPSGSSVHGILQARTLEWGAISFSRGSSRLRVWIQDSCIAADSLPSEAPGKPRENPEGTDWFEDSLLHCSFSEWPWVKCSFTRTVCISALLATPPSILTQQIFCSGVTPCPQGSILTTCLCRWSLTKPGGCWESLKSYKGIWASCGIRNRHKRSIRCQGTSLPRPISTHLSLASPFHLSSSLFSTPLCGRVLSR